MPNSRKSQVPSVVALRRRVRRPAQGTPMAILDFPLTPDWLSNIVDQKTLHSGELALRGFNLKKRLPQRSIGQGKSYYGSCPPSHSSHSAVATEWETLAFRRDADLSTSVGQAATALDLDGSGRDVTGPVQRGFGMSTEQETGHPAQIGHREIRPLRKARQQGSGYVADILRSLFLIDVYAQEPSRIAYVPIGENMLIDEQDALILNDIADSLQVHWT
ncbi:hypothetical protein FA15DRAFT_740971 [Coprinopsis marcescibilis]|uniref:Uncharacterized protein n=1 Tax=Coprinopsis marcescibilis TaxID=230819 RepID=A0A5C3KVZ8_COPMA|nr:hypothetical protein FA15DRAFT_740971 [Coprinopsis marcescibilis]